MAFKPVVPKIRTAPGPASQGVRPGAAALSESQVSLTHLLGTTGADKPGSLSCRASSHSGTLSDSGRNSLSSLPTYSTGCSQHTEPGNLPATPHGHPEPPGGYRPPAGPSNSDSGRSSSSKSTGSLSGRGRPSSESGSCERSPLPGEEVLLVRELEDKLREREAELQQLRDSLDENEVAICQVGTLQGRGESGELSGLGVPVWPHRVGLGCACSGVSGEPRGGSRCRRGETWRWWSGMSHLSVHLCPGVRREAASL